MPLALLVTDNHDSALLTFFTLMIFIKFFFWLTYDGPTWEGDTASSRGRRRRRWLPAGGRFGVDRRWHWQLDDCERRRWPTALRRRTTALERWTRTSRRRTWTESRTAAWISSRRRRDGSTASTIPARRPRPPTHGRNYSTHKLLVN